MITVNGAVRGITSGTVRITGRATQGTVTGTLDVTFLPFRYSRISAGSSHTCAVAVGGRLFCFGGGTQGALGNGDQNDRLIPTEVSGNRTFTRVAANVAFTCAVASDQRTYCWGRNNEAQLGLFLMPHLASSGETLGEAMLQAKIEFAASHPDARDVLYGWTLLGDPTLVVVP